MPPHDAVTNDRLLDYLRGDLPDEAAREVAEAIASDATIASQLETVRALHAMVRSGYRPVLPQAGRDDVDAAVFDMIAAATDQLAAGADEIVLPAKLRRPTTERFEIADDAGAAAGVRDAARRAGTEPEAGAVPDAEPAQAAALRTVPLGPTETGNEPTRADRSWFAGVVSLAVAAMVMVTVTMIAVIVVTMTSDAATGPAVADADDFAPLELPPLPPPPAGAEVPVPAPLPGTPDAPPSPGPIDDRPAGHESTPPVPDAGPDDPRDPNPAVPEGDDARPTVAEGPGPADTDPGAAERSDGGAGEPVGPAGVDPVAAANRAALELLRRARTSPAFRALAGGSGADAAPTADGDDPGFVVRAGTRRGDVDDNGVIDHNDARALLDAVVDGDAERKLDRLAADINRDGVIDGADYLDLDEQITGAAPAGRFPGAPAGSGRNATPDPTINPLE
jgi:hypothetical protein